MPWPRAEIAETPAPVPPGTWRLALDRDGRPGAVNMATDQALLDATAAGGPATLRLYRWDPPALSLGRNEPAQRYDRAQIQARSLDVVRRPTGGRAVWHQYELTYAVVAPIAAFGSLPAGYAAIHARLANALQSLGAPATLAPRRPSAPLRAGPCFASSAGGEVVIRGRKIVGSAQVRRGCAVLQHGSILLAGTQALVYALSGEPLPSDPETSLADALGRPVSFDEVARAVSTAFVCDLAAATPTPLPPAPLIAAFRDPAWTWRR